MGARKTEARATGLLRYRSRNRAVAQLKEELEAWFEQHAPAEFERFGVKPSPYFGRRLEHAVARFQELIGIQVDGIAGPQTFGALGVQFPPLPARVSFPKASYPPTQAKWGLQPWVAPQAEGVCLRFGLSVAEGHGGSPPHVRRSDHRWGGAVDLVGPMTGMTQCTIWANRYRADPHRLGAVFRWVGGPARDRNGPEPGHDDHVHLSWYRYGPATSVFATHEFRSR